MINVCDIQVMKPLLAEHGFHFSKAKGQNFLIAPWVPESIAVESGVDETAGVLEIGPGIGPLTQQLCLRAKKVCAVELGHPGSDEEVLALGLGKMKAMLCQKRLHDLNITNIYHKKYRLSLRLS